MEKLDINRIKQLIKDEKIRWTNHIVVRLLQRNITQDDVLNAIKSGELDEDSSKYLIPYIIWNVFASILIISVFFLNI